MPPKAKIPAPIDRPLSRAYLREFTGWSTAYPPGISEPTSLRIMENVMINRDGSARVRPGMRYISFESSGIPLGGTLQWVGSHEAFYLDDGRKAYLFYARTSSGELEPRVMVYDETQDPPLYLAELEDAEIDFDLRGEGIVDLRFTAATTYVKYLQIDNKIFALSNAGESMKMFHVGAGKWAQGLASIEVPSWTVADKLDVVHPSADWVNATNAEEVRRNLIRNPSFETNLENWTFADNVDQSRVNTDDPARGDWHARVKMNAGNNPDPWTGGILQGYWARTTINDIEAGKRYEFSVGLKRDDPWPTDNKRLTVFIEWRRANGSRIKLQEFPTRELTTTYRRFYTGRMKAPDKADQLRIFIAFRTPNQDECAFFMDGAMLEQTWQTSNSYYDASMTPPDGMTYIWNEDPHDSASIALETIGSWVTRPTAEEESTETLIHSDRKQNGYSFAYFYTFYNEIGESAPSQMTVVKTQRPWVAWVWESANAQGEPSGNAVKNGDLAADQLVAMIPEHVWNSALEQDALGWNLYMLTWSDQDSVPVDAVMIGQKEFDENTTFEKDSWMRHSPETSDWPFSMGLPNGTNRFNYSDPQSAGNGIVAADRMVLVYDPQQQARIRWTSNQQGSYVDFSANKGGGYKTLTSGNLYIPAAVKLWQNPQSADTLTILCLGTDGQSTGYYMAPAQVASQSEAVNIMGFEETTATPGTTSPYGCEVLNNSLYHPLDEQLMKSTASNYNINHKEVTQQIADQWAQLVDKHHIVSSQMDQRIYFLVNNPEGEELLEDCWGNELWVFDAAAENGHWSRFLVQGTSLRKIEYLGETYMSVSRPDGLYILDPEYDRDDQPNPSHSSIDTYFIPWRLETNTQGANRAHDAWAHLQQVGIGLGNWQGMLRYGIKGWDIHGMPIEISKIFRDHNPLPEDGTTFDIEDQLLIQRDMKEWFFFAQSVDASELG